MGNPARKEIETVNTGTEVAVIPAGSTALTTLDVEHLRSRIQKIQQAMKKVMKANVHYGKIPGTQKNTLLKPGAEVLLTMFQIAAEPEIQELEDPDGHVRYRVRTRGFHIPTGSTIGYGIGECSTAESKYAWRAAVSTEEYDATEYEARRIKHGYYNGKPTELMQVATNPSDLANTVLKMAKKRSIVDLCLTALGASDVFEQDLEEDNESRDR
ncbi:MAG TPA: hypothetical protein VEY89_02455, partial [Candidatus Dormibacteraeota bacterium]|nr:hypothetical protein [Candidatus Dormibacteraeota bacterium]